MQKPRRLFPLLGRRKNNIQISIVSKGFLSLFALERDIYNLTLQHHMRCLQNVATIDQSLNLFQNTFIHFFKLLHSLLLPLYRILFRRDILFRMLILVVPILPLPCPSTWNQQRQLRISHRDS